MTISLTRILPVKTEAGDAPAGARAPSSLGPINNRDAPFKGRGKRL
jgi:hypothetical protein